MGVEGKVGSTSQKPPTRIDALEAAEIARKFFEQLQSNVLIKDIVLENGTWIVTVGIGFLTEKIRKIIIDANSGRIVGHD